MFIYCIINIIKQNPNRDGSSYIDLNDWIKKQNKTKKNFTNKQENKFVQYAATFCNIFHEEIKNDLQRITKIKPFISKYNWEEIHFQSENDD